MSSYRARETLNAVEITDTLLVLNLERCSDTD
jgi:hypothetical protein